MSVAGLKTTVFPATSAGVIFQEGIAIGKFHGVMTPMTSIGMRTDIWNLSRSSEGVVCRNRAPPFPAHVVAHVDRFLDVAAGLGFDLSHLVRHQVGQLRLVLAEELANRKRSSPRLGAGTSRHSS